MHECHSREMDDDGRSLNAERYKLFSLCLKFAEGILLLKSSLPTVGVSIVFSSKSKHL